MKYRRLQIKMALEAMVESEQWKPFQRLAIHLAKAKYPELVATEEHYDGGEDATAFLAGTYGHRRRLACSLTGALEKVRGDAKRIKERGVQLDELIFVTASEVTNLEVQDW